MLFHQIRYLQLIHYRIRFSNIDKCSSVAPIWDLADIPITDILDKELWRLATNIEYRTLAALFGIWRSTAGEIFLETCEVTAKILFPKYVKFPYNEELRDIVKQNGAFHKL